MLKQTLNQAVEEWDYLYLIDDLRFYEKIDKSKQQIYLSGWILNKKNPLENVDLSVDAQSASVDITRLDRKDVCDMYDVEAEKIGFQIKVEGPNLLEDMNTCESENQAKADADSLDGFITITASCSAMSFPLLEIDARLLISHTVDNVHFMKDQFALNGTVVRMAGWGYLSDFHEEYRPISVWAEDNGVEVGRAQYMLRPDIVALFKTPEDQGRQWGFFLLLDLAEHPSCDIHFGEEGCNKTWHIELAELQREKREKRRRYRDRFDMLLHKDALQNEDDAYYKKHLSKEEYDAIISARLNPVNVDYDVWMRRHVILPEKELKKQRRQTFEKMPLISIAVPAFRTPEKFLREMVTSVQNQTYPNWELCIADGSLDGSLTPILEELSKEDSRIRFATLDENYGISGNTNKALELATGDYIALLDHDDILTPDALFENVKRINETDADCLYSDEDKVDFELEDYFEPHFKPDFNLDMLRSCNYICHFFVIRRDVMERAGLFNEEYDGSQDLDFILRCTSTAKKVEHIRKMLYHWRSHAASTAMNPENKMYCYTAGRKAIHDELTRQGYTDNHVENYTRLGYYEAVYPVTGNPSLSIVTYEKNCAIVEMLQNRDDWYENTEVVYVGRDNGDKFKETELIDNSETGAESSFDNLLRSTTTINSDYVLFLDGTLKDASENWLQKLLGNALRPEVGILAPMVYNELGRVSSSGKVIMPDGRIRDLFHGLLKEEPGNAAHALMQQDVSVVSNHAFLIARSDVKRLQDIYEGLNDQQKENQSLEALALFCREVLERNQLVVYTPFVQVKEKESPISEEITVAELATGESDPHYHPAFDADGEMYTLRL